MVTGVQAARSAAYEEQAKSYDIMSKTAREAAMTENEIAGKTETAGSIGAFGNFAGGLLKGAAAIATLGSSEVVGYAAESAIGDVRGLGSLY